MAPSGWRGAWSSGGTLSTTSLYLLNISGNRDSTTSLGCMFQCLMTLLSQSSWVPQDLAKLRLIQAAHSCQQWSSVNRYACPLVTLICQWWQAKLKKRKLLTALFVCTSPSSSGSFKLDTAEAEGEKESLRVTVRSTAAEQLWFWYSLTIANMRCTFCNSPCFWSSSLQKRSSRQPRDISASALLI